MLLSLLDRKWIFSLLLLFTVDAVAAVPNPSDFTNFTDPGRAGKSVQQNPSFLPKPQSKTVLKQAPEQKASHSRIRLTLSKVNFIGNTAFSSQDLEKIFSPSYGKTISLDDLEVLVHAVTTKYREQGFILSRAILPPQTIRKGVVSIQIIEGFISNISVKGTPGTAKDLLEAYARRAMKTKPLQFHDLQRYALLANDLPGFSVQTVLAPSPTVPAGADLTFVVTQKRASGYILYDNYGTRYLGPLETTVGGTLDSVFVPGDSNNAQFTVTTRPHELQYSSITHTQPIGTDGMRWQVALSYAETKPSFVLNELNIVGRNVDLTSSLTYPILRDREHNLSVHTGLNYQNITSEILGFPFYEDRIRSLNVGFNFDNIDKWRGINTAGFDITHGFPILGSNVHENLSRPNGQSIYTRLNLALSRLQGITSRLALFLAFHGQYSFQSLLATEQFGVGGSDTGRGYDPSEIVGDTGISGKLELRYDAYPQRHYLQAIQYFAFLDGGKIWNVNPEITGPSQTVTSAGMGARFTFVPQLTGSIFIAKPLDHPVSVLTLLRQNGTGARIFFQVSATA